MLAAERMGETGRAARGPALHRTGLRRVEVQVPGGWLVPVEVGSGTALSEQDVDDPGSVILAALGEGGEHLPQAPGEPLQTGGLIDPDLGSARPRFPQGPLGTRPHLLRTSRGHGRSATGLGRGERVDEGDHDLDCGRNVTVEVYLTSYRLKA